MREIKFRVWDESKNIMYQPNVVDLFVDFVGNFYSINTIGHLVPIRGLKLMQYTGLKDKNGKEIYESDLISVKRGGIEIIYIVYHGEYNLTFAKGTYDEEKHSFYGFYIKCAGSETPENILDIKNEDFFVIGNIYENPELIQS